ncbi:MAG TPA: RHS repeat-associated core domain-containing protein, partial [Tepidisphaeraceae bacterium]|nr:RHS repeat-associated core domain-containing protein [Tepidisphaeraceae bacterium]
HAEERSSLYEPFSNGSPTGGHDSLNRLRQYQRGVLTSDDGFAGNGGGNVATPIALPNTDTRRTYDLDSLGNWRRTAFTPEGGSSETEVRQHNGLNEITRIQNASTEINLLYDGIPGASNGNLANDGTREFFWDALNRLLEVKRVSDGAIIGQYVYDALNRRIRKVVSNGGLSTTIPNGTTDCIYLGWRCVEERDGSNNPTIQYIWGIYLDELLQQFNIVAINGFAANIALYPLQDLLYRTTGLADSSGVIREAFDTDAYGNTLIFRNSGTPPSAITWSDSDTQVNYPTCTFIFTGQRYDAETQVYYYKRRFYCPNLGRFASRDPKSLRLNPFTFVQSRPTAALDPSGMTTYYCNAGLSGVGDFVKNAVQVPLRLPCAPCYACLAANAELGPGALVACSTVCAPCVAAMGERAGRCPLPHFNRLCFTLDESKHFKCTFKGVTSQVQAVTVGKGSPDVPSFPGSPCVLNGPSQMFVAEWDCDGSTYYSCSNDMNDLLQASQQAGTIAKTSSSGNAQRVPCNGTETAWSEACPENLLGIPQTPANIRNLGPMGLARLNPGLRGQDNLRRQMEHALHGD